METLCHIVINGEQISEWEKAGDIRPNLKLIHRFQRAKNDIIKMSREVKYDKNNTEHEKDLMSLWTSLKPD
jgi:hypothetical protein